jgi:hypothetical protein
MATSFSGGRSWSTRREPSTMGSTDLSEAKSVFIYLYASSPDAAACHVCLPRKYSRFMLLIDNDLLLPGAKLHILNNIYRK